MRTFAQGAGYYDPRSRPDLTMVSRPETRLAAVQDPRLAPSLAALLVGCCAIALWLWAGARGDEIALFLAYELGFVILPGLLLYWILSPRVASRLRRLAIGWALGHVVEVLAFILTAALGLRGLFAVYPAVVLLAAGAIWVRRRGRSPEDPAADDPDAEPGPPREIVARWSWAVAGACLLALAFLWYVHYSVAPLPRDVERITYDHDYMYYLSIAAEARHHWPVENPNVSGTPLPYHYFSELHMAGVNQVTGLDLPTVYLVLFPLPLILLLVCQLSIAGRTLGRNWWAGPLAAAMVIWIGEIDLSNVDNVAFLGQMQIYLRYSPSFLFGAVMFVPLVILLCERLASRQLDVAKWLLLFLLVVGCAGSDGVILPLVLGGLGVYGTYRWLVQRRIDRPTLISAGITGVVLLAFTLTLYEGGTGVVDVSLPGGLSRAVPFEAGATYLPERVHWLYWTLAAPIVFVLLLGASMLGLIWLIQTDWRSLLPREAFPLAVLASSWIPLILIRHYGGGGEYFPAYGVLAAAPLSAAGLCRLATRWGANPPGSIVRAALFAALWAVVLVAIAFRAPPLISGPDEVVFTYLAVYGFLGVAIGAIWLWARRSEAAREHRLVYPVLVLLVAAAVNLPIDYGKRLADGWPHLRDLYPTEGVGLTAGIRDGLGWVRDNTEADAVLAVSNSATPEARIQSPVYFYVAALAERRTLLQGFEFTARAQEIGGQDVGLLEIKPFPRRLRLQRAAFERPTAPLLRMLSRKYGVTELVLDKQNGSASPRLGRLLPLVYSSPALEVFRLDPERLRRRAGP